MVAQRECLRHVGVACSALLRVCDGNVQQLGTSVRAQLFAPHVDIQRVQHHFGDIKQFPQIAQVLRALSPGAPVDVKSGGHLEAELAYGNHSSALPHVRKITEKIVSDVILGRALVFDVQFIREISGVRVSPLGVVEEPKFHIIHDLTFSAGAEIRSSVNSDTDFDQAPECLLGHVLFDILSRILFMQQLYGELLEILLCRVDVKEAFRQIPVDPAGASVFGYTMGDQAVVDLRFQYLGSGQARVFGRCFRPPSNTLTIILLSQMRSFPMKGQGLCSMTVLFRLPRAVGLSRCRRVVNRFWAPAGSPVHRFRAILRG